jgi:hypothetical protein
MLPMTSSQSLCWNSLLDKLKRKPVSVQGKPQQHSPIKYLPAAAVALLMFLPGRQWLCGLHALSTQRDAPSDVSLAAALQDGQPRFRYLYVKELPASGGASSSTAASADALWSAVVKNKEYGQYPLQPVAAYVADMVHLHHHPLSTPHKLNFTPEVRAQVSAVPGCWIAVYVCGSISKRQCIYLAS